MIVPSQNSHSNMSLPGRITTVTGRLRAGLAALSLIAICGAAIGNARAAVAVYQSGHVYVNYTSAWVPCSQGNLVDVTTELVVDDTQGHVHDLYGNHLTINSTTKTVFDVNAQAAGFVY